MLHPTNPLTIVFFLAAAINCNASLAEGLIGDPRLSISGPEGQTVSLTVRYFDRDKVAKTVTSRIEINTRDEPQQLEFGFSAMRVFVTVPTKLPVTVILLDGNDEISTKVSDGIQTLEITNGELPVGDVFAPPRALLNENERDFAERFLAAFQTGQTQTLVSPSDLANIDWQTLDAYCQSANAELGTIAANSSELDGWLSWEGSLGVRVLSGVVRFQRGSCRLSLMVSGEQLVDVVPESSEMPVDWFAGPSSDTEFVERSRNLSELLFAGSIPASRALFSRLYHDTVTIDALQTLSDSLRQQFGTAVERAEFKSSDLVAKSANTDTRTLRIQHALILNSGKRCISRVEINFPCGPNLISRGHLASINVWEAWLSATPELVEIASTTLKSLTTGGAFADIERLLHADVRKLTDINQLKMLAKSVPNNFGTWVATPDWDMWTAAKVGDNLSAQGPIKLDAGTVDVQIDFVGDQLLGITLLAPFQTFSSLNLVRDTPQADVIGREFWQDLLTGNLPEAHKRLAPIFREQIPLEKFTELVRNSQIDELGALNSITFDVARFTNRINRPLPIMVSSYYVAEFEAGKYQPLRCEFRSNEQGDFELLDFNSEFETSFPVQTTNEMRSLIEAFQSGESERVIDLLAETDQQQVEPAILAAFLRKLNSIAGKLQVSPNSRMMHEYSNGYRIERLSCLMQNSSDPLPLSGVFQYGKLRSFVIDSPELASFANQIENQSCLNERCELFAKQWMSTSPDATLRLMTRDLQTAQTARQLTLLRTRLVTQYGAFLSANVTTLRIPPDSNSALATVEMQFSNGVALVEIELAIDAFTAPVSALRVRQQ